MGVVGFGVAGKLDWLWGYPGWESDRGKGLGSDWGMGGGPTAIGLGCAGL